MPLTAFVTLALQSEAYVWFFCLQKDIILHILFPSKDAMKVKSDCIKIVTILIACICIVPYHPQNVSAYIMPSA